MNPFAPIRTEPLKADGVSTGYRMVQLEQTKNIDGNAFTEWNDIGKPVSSSYLLIPNQDVRDVLLDITDKTSWDWSEPKNFFDGKRYMVTMTSSEVQGDVDVNDPVSLGIGAWNSYDGSKAFSLFMFINRLVCENGMLSKEMFNTFRFRHTQDNDNWSEDVRYATDFIKSGPEKVDEWIKSAKGLNTDLNGIDDLRNIRENAIADIPVSTFGKIVDQFLTKEDKTEWGFLNAGTHVLWHSKTPTVSMYEQNAQFTDAMLKYKRIG
jgi:hypothetical protein